eukprot:Nitzschia sp. Nitz4//scaffold368_size14544//3087//5870//NITZ4_008930-RA/size14544-processed-gene-0.7-mRNA-1//1//CDS//3329549340//521//frame0
MSIPEEEVHGGTRRQLEPDAVNTIEDHEMNIAIPASYVSVPRNSLELNADVHIVEDSDLEMLFSDKELSSAIETEDSSNGDGDEDENGIVAWGDRKPSAVSTMDHETVSLSGKDISVLEEAYADDRKAAQELRNEVATPNDVASMPKPNQEETVFQAKDTAENASASVDKLDTFENVWTPAEMKMIEKHISDEPLDMDVLDGRGAIVRENPGNVRMREIVSTYVQRYRDAPSRGKAPIVREAVDEIEAGCVRFWVQEKSKSKGKKMQYRLATDEEVYDKVWHCFRSIITKQNRTSTNSEEDDSAAPSSKRARTARLEDRPAKVQHVVIDESVEFASLGSDVECGPVRVGGKASSDDDDDDHLPESSGVQHKDYDHDKIVKAELVPVPIVATDVTKEHNQRNRERWIGFAVVLVLAIVGVCIAVVTGRSESGKRSPTPAPTWDTPCQSYYSMYNEVLSPFFNDTFPASDLQVSSLEWLAYENQLCGVSNFTSRELLERFVAFLIVENWGVTTMDKSSLATSSVCDWDMISCNDEGLIQDLSITDTSNRAAFPSEIGLLQHLELLDVREGNIEGSLPLELQRCTALRQVSLRYCKMVGTFPIELAGLTRLEVLNLASNSFEGTIPSQVGQLSGLRVLELSNNEISGTLPLELTDLTMLTQVGLEYNRVNGTIPTLIGKLENLKNINFRWNLISGSLPSEIGELGQLTRLDFFHNVMTGSLPSEIGSLSRLMEIDLDDNDISGTLPTDLGLMTSLRELYVSNNQLNGTLPAELGLMTSLLSLQLDGMSLQGSIPLQLSQIAPLEYLALSDNQLSGVIPTEIGNLTNLKGLSLGKNNFSGGLPTELDQLTALEALVLSENGLTGTIPSEWSSMESLVVLYMNATELEGSIPTEFAKMTNLLIVDIRDTLVNGTLSGDFQNSSVVIWWDRTE